MQFVDREVLNSGEQYPSFLLYALAIQAAMTSTAHNGIADMLLSLTMKTHTPKSMVTTIKLPTEVPFIYYHGRGAL